MEGHLAAGVGRGGSQMNECIERVHFLYRNAINNKLAKCIYIFLFFCKKVRECGKSGVGSMFRGGQNQNHTVPSNVRVCFFL